MTTATPVRSYWKLKGCPRCHGDILVAAGDSRCLQCGCDLNAVAFTPLDRVELQEEVEELLQIATPKRQYTRRIRLTKAELTARDFELRKMRRDGLPVQQIAREFKISVTYAYKILEGAR